MAEDWAGGRLSKEYTAWCEDGGRQAERGEGGFRAKFFADPADLLLIFRERGGSLEVTLV